MKNIKEHFSEYGFLSLLVVPVFFVISYLFNVVYFFAFGVSLSQIPLAVSDYIMSVNAFGIIVLWGIIWQIIIVIPAEYCRKRFRYIFLGDDSNFPQKLDELKQFTNNIRTSLDSEDIKMKKTLQAENDFKQLKEASSRIFQRAEKKITKINITFLIASILALSFFIYSVSTDGIFHAKFFLLAFPFLSITLFYCRHIDSFYFWLILTFFTCLTYSLDDSLRNALDDYKNDSVEVTTHDNKYFNMRSFENGFWVKNAETGEVLFITKAGDILNFHQPQRIFKHLANEKHD